MSSHEPACVISPHFSPEGKRLLNIDDLAERKPLTLRHQVAFFDSARFRPGVEHLIVLGGVRPVTEFLGEIGVAHEISDDILERLNRWRDRLTPELLRAVGGDRFPAPFAVLRGGRR